MNQQMRFSPTVEARLAGAVMRVMRHFAKKYGRENVMAHVDHRDFAEEFSGDIRPSIHRELLQAELKGLQVTNGERERRRREVVIELAEIDKTL